MASEARASTIILGSLPVLVTGILSRCRRPISCCCFVRCARADAGRSRDRMLITGIAIMVKMARFEYEPQYPRSRFHLKTGSPAGVSPDPYGVIAGLAALTVLVALYAVWLALRPRNPYERRSPILPNARTCCGGRRSVRRAGSASLRPRG